MKVCMSYLKDEMDIFRDMIVIKMSTNLVCRIMHSDRIVEFCFFDRLCSHASLLWSIDYRDNARTLEKIIGFLFESCVLYLE